MSESHLFYPEDGLGRNRKLGMIHSYFLVVLFLIIPNFLCLFPPKTTLPKHFTGFQAKQRISYLQFL